MPKCEFQSFTSRFHVRKCFLKFRGCLLSDRHLASQKPEALSCDSSSCRKQQFVARRLLDFVWLSSHCHVCSCVRLFSICFIAYPLSASVWFFLFVCVKKFLTFAVFSNFSDLQFTLNFALCVRFRQRSKTSPERCLRVEKRSDSPQDVSRPRKRLFNKQKLKRKDCSFSRPHRGTEKKLDAATENKMDQSRD